MAFDLENAVQQGFNRDVTTNDWNVEATNLEIVLGDRTGGTSFEIKDVDLVTAAEVTSDGYLSILGNAEINGGHILVNAPSAELTNSEFVTLRDTIDESSIFLLDSDPDGSIIGSRGSIGLDYTNGEVYVNRDDSTDWSRLARSEEVSAVNPTLQNAYDNDADGGDATITTNATDGAVVIAGDQKLQVTATGGLDLDAGFDQDATNANFEVDLTSGYFSMNSDTNSDLTVTNANLTLETVTSGDIIARIPATGGDFVVDEGVGIDYIRAESVSSELRLGSIASGTGVDVRVLSNMVVDGDLTVEGTTTTVNTEELYVEDRLMRLNINAAPTFSGTVGIEAEVGSDGYVEFHWDDTDGRWEISIDRNTTPEAQTFRPLPYLADSPATLDLSNTGDDGWPTAGPNPTAGASVVNTNATNFPYSFGPDMADDSVQAALEAIDGYFIEIAAYIDTANDVTLHQAYKNDPDGGDATITTDATDGAVVIAGTEKLQVTATGGIDLDTGFDMDGAGPFDVDITGVVSIDSDAASNFTVDGANLTLSTTTSGDVIVNAATDVDVDGTNVDIDASSAFSIDGAAASNVSVDGGNLTLSTTTSGDVILNSVADIDGDAVNVNFDATSAISLDAAAASNFTVAGANLTLDTTTSGDVVINPADDVDMDATNVYVDATSAISLDAGAASNFTTSAGAITVDGAGGIVLEGNTNNVIPGTSCTDSLGDASHGWTSIWLCKNGTPREIGGPGDVNAPNYTSGASIVGTNATNFETFGPDMTENTVQAALEAIDGYLSDLSLEDLDTTYVKEVGLDINGAVLNGVVRVSTDAGTPALDFKKNQTSRASWAIPVPTDWDGVSDIEVEAVWSPATSGAGNVEWRLEYKALSVTELASAAATTDDYTQTAGGTADAIQTTADNLVIPAAAVSTSDEIIVINLVRRGAAAGDTYGNYAQVHLVKFSYVAQNIV